MEFWGIVIAVAARVCGVGGAVLAFIGWDRKNKGEDARLLFTIAIIGGFLFAGLLYLGGKLGLLW
ncbi:MAG: hypothetical protein E3J71_05755 [Candidatus Stahlbacteria bacterium]|nr:MAG: hypothetical protein E3J71_05755 [Candidatus Stahlbacteria bacterium]